MALPFADASVDICLSSNVAEHVPQPWRLGREMLRVTKPGGLAVLSYTVWLGPFGGHEMGLWHYLAGPAPRRYTRKHGHPAKNDYGSSLFAVSAADGLQWAASTGALVAAFPRYHPRWAWWMTRVPVLREFLVSNLVLVLRPPDPQTETGSRFAVRWVGWRHDTDGTAYQDRVGQAVHRRQWVEPSTSEVIEVHSPATGELVGKVPMAAEADVNAACAAARKAFDEGPWPQCLPRSGPR